MPPQKPSTLLLGEILGASLCLPSFDPTKYAHESLSQMDPMTAKVRRAPLQPGKASRMITMLENASDV
jgi:hypothetical protein